MNVCVDVESMENFWLCESLGAGFESTEWRFKFQMERLVSILHVPWSDPGDDMRCDRKPFLCSPIRTSVNIPFLFYFFLIFICYFIFYLSSPPYLLTILLFVTSFSSRSVI